MSVSSDPRPRLSGPGWVPLDPLLARRPRFGRPGRAGGHWAVAADGRVLAGLRLRPEGDSGPVRSVLDRAGRRGEVRLREVLELRELRRRGERFPATAPALTAAADIESGLGGRELVRWTSGRRAAPPVRLRGGRRQRGIVVAGSGVDGSGKTTLMENLARDLSRAGVPVTRVWLRPGMGLGWLTALADGAKRVLRIDPRPGIGVRAVEPQAQLRSRQGVVGWAWALLVTVSYLVAVRRQQRAAVGVVLFDRHIPDALATLDFAYAGSDLRLQRWLLRRMTPPAAATFYLDVPAEVAVARKPGDLIAEQAVQRQLVSYQRWLPRVPRVCRLDGTRPAAELSSSVLRWLTRDAAG